LIALLQSSLSFNVKPVVVSRLQVTVSRRSRAKVFLAQDDEDEDETSAPLNNGPPQQPQSAAGSSLDVSASRMDSTVTKNQENSKAKAPLFGEIPVDGGLVVLIPAAVIAVVGVITSLVVIFSAHDTFSDPVSQQMTQDINTAAIVQTESSLPMNAAADCRGLCSNHQDEQLESMKLFMEGISKR
jgi:hypothetical protein